MLAAPMSLNPQAPAVPISSNPLVPAVLRTLNPLGPAALTDLPVLAALRSLLEEPVVPRSLPQVLAAPALQPA